MPGDSAASPETSVIIRTFNEEKHLPALMESLDRQSYRDFEIVVVDSGSLDRTRELATGHADTMLRIDSHDFTFGYSLNVGINAALGKYAVIVSAHTLPVDDDWIGRLVTPLREDVTAMTYGRQMGGSGSNFSEIQDLGRTFGSQRKVLRPPHFFAHNGNSAIRRDLWAQHPFDEKLPGLEDIEWAKFWMERGYQVVYDPDAALHHIHNEHWRQIRLRYYREGVAARLVGVKGRQHVVIDVAREAGFTLFDLGRALLASEKQFQHGTGLLDRGREIFSFRSNKILGTVRGLLDGTSIQDPETREKVFFDRTSPGVVFHGAGRASLQQQPIPDVKPGDVLIRTAYTGICGTDLELFNGTLSYYQDGDAKYPIVPGHEVSGRVVAVGPNVRHLEEGNPVVIEKIQSCGNCDDCRRSNWSGCPNRVELGVIGRAGGFAQFLVTPGRYVHKVPPDLSLQRSVLCEPLAVILKGLSRVSQFWPTEPKSKRCAVVGGGSLGHMCAKVMSFRGHRVTVFDQDPKRRGYFEGSDIAVSADLSELYNFDVLIEVTGDPQVLDTLLHQSGPSATILLLDLPYADKQISLEKFLAHDKAVVSSSGSTPKEYEEALALLPQLNVDLLLECVFPMEQFREALQTFEQRRYLKVMLEVAGESS